MSVQILKKVCLAILLPLLILSSFSAQSHTLEPSIINLTLSADGKVSLDIETDAEAWLSGVLDIVDDEEAPEAQAYQNLRELSPEAIAEAFKERNAEFANEFSVAVADSTGVSTLLEMAFDSIAVPGVGDTSESRKSMITFRTTLPESAETFVWQMHEKFGDSVLFVITEGEEQKPMFWLPAGGVSEPISIAESVKPRTTSDIIADYFSLGVFHIVPHGLDHILFVLGLFLFSRRFKPLLWQVTAFTLAHTITLALSSQGIINLPADVVEPLIALSIIYIAIENIFRRSLRNSRLLVVFGFGLLHGLGFASALSGLGLPDSEFLTALIAFNVGVEAGQLSIIAVAFIAVFVPTQLLNMSQDRYRKLIVIPASVLISMTGLYWLIERIFF